MGGYVTGWKLPRDGERERLLERFPPEYERTVADHVTLQAGASQDTPLPREVEARIVGRADDGKGVEAMVVRLGGTTGRPDGSIYHITWSLEEGRRAKESNDVIARSGWTEFDPPVPLTLTPARFRGKTGTVPGRGSASGEAALSRLRRRARRFRQRRDRHPRPAAARF